MLFFDCVFNFLLTNTIIYIRIKTSLVFKDIEEHNEVLSNKIEQRSYKKNSVFFVALFFSKLGVC